jgi:thiazole synthase
MDQLTIAGKAYGSRLLVGTGKYKDFAETKEAIGASGAEIVTVAIRRMNIGQDPKQPNLLDAIPPSKYTILPNTAGCYTADDAVRTLRLARELLDGHALVKLEVLGDPTNLFPNMPETLKAAETLVKDGFEVMVYCADDPIQCQDAGRNRLRGGDAAGQLIGSGMGILNPWNLRLIIDNAKVPVHGRCRCRHGVGRSHRDGTRLRRRADEHRHRPRAEPGADGRP